MAGNFQPSNFVNGMRNVARIAGVVSGYTEDGRALVRQSRNEATAIPVRLSDTMRERAGNRPPLRVGELFEFYCHVFGAREWNADQVTEGYSPQPKLELEAFYVRTPSIGNVSGIGTIRAILKHMLGDALPAEFEFMKVDDLKKIIEEKLGEDGAYLTALVDGVTGNRNNRGMENFVLMTGILSGRRVVGNEGSDDERYAILSLLQHGNLDKAIPVRVNGVNNQWANDNLKSVGLAFNIIGQLRVIYKKDDEGNILSSELQIVTNRKNISLAAPEDIKGRNFSEWFGRLCRGELHKDFEAKLKTFKAENQKVSQPKQEEPEEIPDFG